MWTSGWNFWRSHEYSTVRYCEQICMGSASLAWGHTMSDRTSDRSLGRASWSTASEKSRWVHTESWISWWTSWARILCCSCSLTLMSWNHSRHSQYSCELGGAHVGVGSRPWRSRPHRLNGWSSSCPCRCRRDRFWWSTLWGKCCVWRCSSKPCFVRCSRGSYPWCTGRCHRVPSSCQGHWGLTSIW